MELLALAPAALLVASVPEVVARSFLQERRRRRQRPELQWRNRARCRPLAVAILLVLALATPASATEQRPTLSELEHEVMCPTCHTLLELSNAPIAQRMRAFIRARIAADDTKGVIKAKLVAQFGEAVLASPRTSGFDLLAWVLPLVGLVGGGGLVGLVAWGWARAGNAELAPHEQDDQTDPDPAIERRLQEELARFD
jgi:cytochrome c-type biogenesis protein CcmH